MAKMGTRKHLLLTKELEKKLPALYSKDAKDPSEVKIVVKFFSPYSGATWYATEYDPKERMFFGYAEMFPGGGELGYFSLDELDSVTVFGGVPAVERDCYFGEHYLKEILDGGRP